MSFDQYHLTDEQLSWLKGGDGREQRGMIWQRHRFAAKLGTPRTFPKTSIPTFGGPVKARVQNSGGGSSGELGSVTRVYNAVSGLRHVRFDTLRTYTNPNGTVLPVVFEPQCYDIQANLAGCEFYATDCKSYTTNCQFYAIDCSIDPDQSGRDGITDDYTIITCAAAGLFRTASREASQEDPSETVEGGSRGTEDTKDECMSGQGSETAYKGKWKARFERFVDVMTHSTTRSRN